VKYGPKSDDERHQAFTKFTGREIASAKHLTRDEADRFVAALRSQPDYVKPTPAADGNENFRQAEELLKLEQGQEGQELEADLLDAIQSSENGLELTAAMTAVTGARDAGRISKEQFAHLATAADQRAANARKQLAGVPA
jgi:hypothetical protein